MYFFWVRNMQLRRKPVMYTASTPPTPLGDELVKQTFDFRPEAENTSICMICQKDVNNHIIPSTHNPFYSKCSPS